MKLSDNLYNILKWLGLIFCPALAVLLATVLPVWGVDAGLIKALVITINAVGVFIGALIGVSQITIAKENSEEEFYEIETEDEAPVTPEDLEGGEV